MELKTIPHKQNTGTLLKIEGGVVEDIADAGGTRGTSVTVKNLFYNTPARRKFLKTDETEYRYILNVIQRFTLAYFQSSFAIYHNDNKIFGEYGIEIPYIVGTMIELPRAALTADEIATEAEFFSFGTNDLTQTALGLSRDDAGNRETGDLRARGIRTIRN